MIPMKPQIWIQVILVVIGVVFYSGRCSATSNTCLTDKAGRVISLARPYKRIISLYSAHTENLFQLGADSQIIGVSINDKYPPRVDEKNRFSYHDGLEKYLAAKPDLVLIRPMIDNGYPEFVRQLESYGIVVVSLQPATIDEMYDYWLALGRLCGKTQAASEMTLKFKGRVRAIAMATQAITPKRRVYFEAIHKRMKTFTPNAMPLFALKIAGGLNVATDARASRGTNVANYSKEKILSKGHFIDVFIAQKGLMNPIRRADILNEPGFDTIKAIKNNQVLLVDEAIVSRPVPRLVQGILAIGNYLYPDIFNSLTNPTEESL